MAEQEKKLTGYKVSILSHETEDTVKEFTVTKKQIKLGLAAGGLLLTALLVWAVFMTVLFSDRNQTVQTVSTSLSEAESYTSELEQQIEELTEKNTILSATVNRKVEEEESRMAQEAELYEPTGIPVNGTVLYTEETTEEGQPYIEFTADLGAEVVAAGSGTVILSAEDPEWGYRIEIDHGNGYISTYRVRENPKVVEGAEIRKGDILFPITKSERTIIYQIIQDGTYIDPMGIMEIYG